MIRIQTETRTEMFCIKDIIKSYCDKCKNDFSCNECNLNNITFELINLSYSTPVEQWDFSQ